MRPSLKNSLTLKLLTLVVLTLLLCIPLAQIGWLINERGSTQQRAAQELAATHAGPQTLVGPVLVVPYLERWSEAHLDENGKLKSRSAHSKQMTHLVYPRKLDIAGSVSPQQRQRGIFSVLFYDLQGKWAGDFLPPDPARIARSEKDSSVELLAPYLVFGLSDVRGIQGSPVLQLAGEPLRFLPGMPFEAQGSLLASGIHAPVTGAALKAFEARQPMQFDLGMAVTGQQRLSIAPLGDDTSARLAMRWPHLSFGGRFLALERTATDAGFNARWAVSSLVSAAGQQVTASVNPANRAQGPRQLPLDTFDVSLIQPQNTYSMSDRAVKYGALFVGLTLLAAFMFELFGQLKLHPVQYALVGVSIAVFFLLLLALSEKLDFALAYGLASGASAALLMVYFSAVLHGWRRGLSLATFVGLLYAALYGLLVSEDNALLMGSVLVFGMLAALMLLTRKVDWYALAPGGAGAGVLSEGT
ncbi:MAG TPA: cell envelope integrity protein CreD [Ramlibacter sp.]|nr:cell envelope integrity protein CreD [Ramlibacter sp.]